jgi:hypothetical protein
VCRQARQLLKLPPHPVLNAAHNALPNYAPRPISEAELKSNESERAENKSKPHGALVLHP